MTDYDIIRQALAFDTRDTEAVSAALEALGRIEKSTKGMMMQIDDPTPGRRRKISVCCKEFERATRSGTDNEGYGPLIHITSDLMWMLGCDLPQPFHCPWCGAMPKLEALPPPPKEEG